MTQRNTLFILMGVFIGLVILAAIQSARPPATPTPSAQGMVNRLFSWGVQDIQAFSIRDPYTGASLGFQRDNNDTWTSIEVPDASADQDAVNQMGLTLAVMPVLEKLDQVTAADYPEFGLTQTDAFLILIAFLKNGEQHTIIIGDVASGNVSHYALVDDHPEVYLLDARPIAYLVAMLKQVYEPTPEGTAQATAEATP